MNYFLSVCGLPFNFTYDVFGWSKNCSSTNLVMFAPMVSDSVFKKNHFLLLKALFIKCIYYFTFNQPKIGFHRIFEVGICSSHRNNQLYQRPLMNYLFKSILSPSEWICSWTLSFYPTHLLPAPSTNSKSSELIGKICTLFIKIVLATPGPMFFHTNFRINLIMTISIVILAKIILNF